MEFLSKKRLFQNQFPPCPFSQFSMCWYMNKVKQRTELVALWIMIDKILDDHTDHQPSFDCWSAVILSLAVAILTSANPSYLYFPSPLESFVTRWWSLQRVGLQRWDPHHQGSRTAAVTDQHSAWSEEETKALRSRKGRPTTLVLSRERENFSVNEK